MQRVKLHSRLPVLGVCLLFAITWTSTALAAHEYSGTVVSAQSGRLILAMGTEQLTFVVDHETKISLNGAPAELEKLQPGYAAAVSADRLGQLFMARNIKARRTSLP